MRMDADVEAGEGGHNPAKRGWRNWSFQSRGKWMRMDVDEELWSAGWGETT